MNTFHLARCIFRLKGGCQIQAKMSPYLRQIHDKVGVLPILDHPNFHRVGRNRFGLHHDILPLYMWLSRSFHLHSIWKIFPLKFENWLFDGKNSRVWPVNINLKYRQTWWLSIFWFRIFKEDACSFWTQFVNFWYGINWTGIKNQFFDPFWLIKKNFGNFMKFWQLIALLELGCKTVCWFGALLYPPKGLRQRH